MGADSESFSLSAPNYISSLEPGQEYGVDVYVNTFDHEDFFEPTKSR